MMRLTNIALVLVAVSGAFGCSAVVNNTLKLKDDAGVDSGVADSGTGDSGPSGNCMMEPGLCNDTACTVDRACDPGNEEADPTTGCTRGDGVPNDDLKACDIIFPGGGSTAGGLCVDGQCAGCGDGVHQADFAEECDDGNDIDGDGCDTDCEFSCHNEADCESFDCDGDTVCDFQMGSGGNNTRQCETSGDILSPGSSCDVAGVFAGGMCFEPGDDGLVCCSDRGNPDGTAPWCCGFFPGNDEYSCGPPVMPP
ncbi:MAG: hypothetical protein JRH11_24255, partial [Deltaproteobacteria bacterium]|nr:hypothetical protein [Deltaproteobacteria bacterium]